MKYKQLLLLTSLATLFLIANLLWLFLDSTSFHIADIQFGIRYYYFLFIILLNVVFLLTIWKDPILNRKNRWDKTWMVLLLGILGMWFYLWDLRNREEG